MRSIFKITPALGLMLAFAGSAEAQWGNRTQIYNSGNGAYNNIHVGNYGGFGGHNNQIINSGNGVGNNIHVGNYGRPVGFHPGFVGGGFHPGHGGFHPGHGGGFHPGFGAPVGYGAPRLGQGLIRSLIPDVNVNVIANSANGVGNSINLQNGGGGFGGPFGGGLLRDRMNFNIISNSGNGAYNHLGVFNGR